MASSEYYTFDVPIGELIRLKFKMETGLDLEESLKITVNYGEGGYTLYSVNDKFIIYNTQITLTDQRVTEDTFKPYEQLLLEADETVY